MRTTLTVAPLVNMQYAIENPKGLIDRRHNGENLQQSYINNKNICCRLEVSGYINTMLTMKTMKTDEQ